MPLVDQRLWRNRGKLVSSRVIVQDHADELGEYTVRLVSRRESKRNRLSLSLATPDPVPLSENIGSDPRRSTTTMSQLQTQLIAAAIGATIGVISAASIFIYQKILENKQRTMKNASLDEVNRRLTELQTELETLRYAETETGWRSCPSAACSALLDPFGTLRLNWYAYAASYSLSRVQQNQQRKKKKLSRKHISNDTTTYTATDNDTDVDAFSTADTDIADDEFFDCSDSENGISDIETRLVRLLYLQLYNYRVW